MQVAETKDDEILETEQPVIIPSGDERVPEFFMAPEEIENLRIPYSTRAVGDWVVSGPVGDLPDSRGGRRFDSWEDAEEWAKSKYGNKFRGRVAAIVDSATNRWGFLIKKIQ
jgi:hypothetical protein